MRNRCALGSERVVTVPEIEMEMEKKSVRIGLVSYKTIAAELSSDTIDRLRSWTEQYGISLITGYFERDREKLYSSCVVLSDGEIIHNYRRISRGWKEFTKTDEHYCEGDETGSFRLCGKNMMIALCGDLWDAPERFQTEHLLIWPVYVNFTPEEWNNGELDEYPVS